MEVTEFRSFGKIARLDREVVVTEKIDGTNAQILISDDLSTIQAGSRNRWIVPGDDNYGFARWVEDNREELLKLGPGRHFGEWWGAGIQRNYGLREKRFSLFNVSKWGETRPACCHVVPVLWRGLFTELDVKGLVGQLMTSGSVAMPGYANPEGIVVYHTHSGSLFKVTTDGDAHKGQ